MEENCEIVRVAQGLLQGRKIKTKSGGPLVSFQGIPYAKPPVGELRFKPPQPPDVWKGIYKAEEEPAVCPQRENGVFQGQEDCLYLNVYAQQVKVETLRPVMVWFHGGGFVNGSGNTDIYGPDYFVDAGVILVTLNYRLGVLGFLSLDNEFASGNMGLKDQVAALNWVQQNIASFGGDANNVTIFGESAGGVCVNYHLLSPMTKGLFHKAIAQSGSSLNPWAFTRACRARTFRLGELLGLKTNDDEELITFLRNTEIETLVKMTEDVLPRIENPSGLKIVFVPTVEPIIEGHAAYLTQDPQVLMKNGQFHHIPYMTGTVTHEGSIMIRAAVKNPSMLDTLNEKFEHVVPTLFQVGLDASQKHEICNKIRQFYLKDEPLSQKTISSYVDLHTDAQMAAGIHITAKCLAKFSSAPVYFYNFAFDGELGCSKKLLGHKGAIIEGPYHADDLGYLFRLGLYDPDLAPDSWEVKIRNRMVKLWTNFAKSGNPTPFLTQELPIKWQLFTISQEKYLDINKEIRMKTHLRNERMAFWEDIYKCKL